jgi:hypothetical protein
MSRQDDRLNVDDHTWLDFALVLLSSPIDKNGKQRPRRAGMSTPPGYSKLSGTPHRRRFMTSGRRTDSPGT